MSLRTLILLSPFAIAVLLGKIATIPEAPDQPRTQKNVKLMDLSMDHYAWTRRPLVLFAPSSVTPEYLETMVILNRNGSSLMDRNMVVIQIFEEGTSQADGRAITPASAARMREAFEIEPEESAIVLVGKDGTEKKRWKSLPPLGEIFGTIDAMPMRQREIEEPKSRPGS